MSRTRSTPDQVEEVDEAQVEQTPAPEVRTDQEPSAPPVQPEQPTDPGTVRLALPHTGLVESFDARIDGVPAITKYGADVSASQVDTVIAQAALAGVPITDSRPADTDTQED